MDREWITLRFPDPRFMDGMLTFVTFAREHLLGREIIHCPCTKCRCIRLPCPIDDVMVDLMKNGFDPTYRVWNMHGELATPKCTKHAPSSHQYSSVVDLNNIVNAVVEDLSGNNLDKVVQSSKPGSRLTSIDDALTQSVESDNRGRMRGIGGTISKIALKKTIPILNKLDTATQEQDNLVQKIDHLEKILEQLHQEVNYMVANQAQLVVVSPPTTPTSFKSSQASSPDSMHAGKRCDLCDWKKRVIARGEVHGVDPTAHVHGAELGEGNFSVVLIEIIVAQAELWKEDDYHRTLGEVGMGGFVVWPRQYITVFP